MLSKHPERPKTPDEVETISTILKLLTEEVARLRGKPVRAISPDDIHILAGAAAENVDAESVLGGRAFTEIGHAVVFDFEHKDLLHKLETIAHEAIHLLSKNVATVAITENSALVQTRDKSGYESSARPSVRYTPTNFRGFNEAVIEHAAQEIIVDMFHRQEELFGREKFSDREFYQFMVYFHRVTAYSRAIHIVENIALRIARESDRDEEEVWDEFKRGLFTGSVLHLRQIEKVYGKGSLRQLAEMPLGAEDGYGGDSEAYERGIEAIADFFR